MWLLVLNRKKIFGINFFFVTFQEHCNFVGKDENVGPILLSMRNEAIGSQENTRLLLRLKTGTMHELVPNTCLPTTPHQIARVSNLVFLYVYD